MAPTFTELYGLPPAPPLFGAAAALPQGPKDLSGLPCQLPDGFKLYPFQVDGVRFLLDNPVALLGDEMGLGKSIQAIVAMKVLLHAGDIRRALILCPKSVFLDWYYKLRRWAPELSTLAIYGARRRREWDWKSGHHVFIANYETWREDGKEVSPHFDLVILDEVQRIKNKDARVTRQIAATLGYVERRWALSGTPLENNLAELTAVMEFLKPGLLPGRGDLVAVREAARPVVLRREKADVLSFLPPKEVRQVWLRLRPAQRLAYERLQQDALARLPGRGAGAYLLTLLNKLKQVCNWDPETGESSKLDHLVAELSFLQMKGEKALIFSQYPDKTLRHVLHRLMPFGVALFDGTLSDWAREELVLRFQQAEVPRVLAMSLKAGGTGITLTRANHVFHFDQWWNPTVLTQAEDRAHRIGQTRPVQVQVLLARNTVEERIAELLEKKRDLFHRVMGDLTSRGREAPPLSTRDLFWLFGLKQ